MSDMLQGKLEKNPDMRVGQSVVGDPAFPVDVDDPMGAEQTQRVRNRRLAQVDHCGDVAHRHPARQQRDQDTHSAGITQQTENVGQIDDLLIRGHAGPNLLNLLGVQAPRATTFGPSRACLVHDSHATRSLCSDGADGFLERRRLALDGRVLDVVAVAEHTEHRVENALIVAIGSDDDVPAG